MLPRLGGGVEHAESSAVVFFSTVDFWQLMLYGYVLTNVELDIGATRKWLYFVSKWKSDICQRKI